MVRVVLFTSQKISHDTILLLHENENIRLELVIYQYTKRDEIYGYTDPKISLDKTGVRHLRKSGIDAQLIEDIRLIKPDLIINAYYPHIFPIALINIAKIGCLNVHPGLLPFYRGTFPTPWQILNGEKEVGVSAHLLDERIDTGPIICQRKTVINENETGFALYQRLMGIAFECLSEALERLLAHSFEFKKQNGGGSYYSNIEARFHIDWSMPRDVILKRIRVHSKPYLPAFGYLFNKILFINKANVQFDMDYVAQKPGQIVSFDGNNILVSCSDGLICVTEYELCPTCTVEELDLHIRVGNFIL